MFVDSHCHLDKLELAHYPIDPENSPLDCAMQAAAESGVSHVLCIGIDLDTVAQVIQLAEEYPNVYATVGSHPLYQESRAPSVEELVSLAEHPKVIGIGETGLDYFYVKGDTAWQSERFVSHIQAAKQTGLPLVIHTRSAKEDTLSLLREHGEGQVKGVLHCFTEDLDMAQQAVDMGFYISISGIVTFNNAHELRAVVEAIPLERLLIETDAPWLTPAPHRGKPNEPKHVTLVAKKIAELKGVTVEEVAATTTENFFTLFNKAQS